MLYIFTFNTFILSDKSGYMAIVEVEKRADNSIFILSIKREDTSEPINFNSLTKSNLSSILEEADLHIERDLEYDDTMYNAQYGIWLDDDLAYILDKKGYL